MDGKEKLWVSFAYAGEYLRVIQNYVNTVMALHIHNISKQSQNFSDRLCDKNKR